MLAATSTSELATSLQRVASMAEASNISLDKMIGLIATGSETTRLSAETIGNSWKSILSRIQNVKAGKNIDEMGEAINDVEKVLGRFNISLRDSEHEFRDISTVLDEVATKWNTLESVERNQIATAIAGEMCARTYSNIWSNYLIA